MSSKNNKKQNNPPTKLRRSLRIINQEYEKKVKIFDYVEEKIEPVYEVNIDFEAAQEAWRKNKIHLGNCYYEYK